MIVTCECKKKREERRRNIRSKMELLGIKGYAVARELGIDKSTVSGVVCGIKTNMRVVETLISKGVPAELFEEYSQEKEECHGTESKKTGEEDCDAQGASCDGRR